MRHQWLRFPPGDERLAAGTWSRARRSPRRIWPSLRRCCGPSDSTDPRPEGPRRAEPVAEVAGPPGRRRRFVHEVIDVVVRWFLAASCGEARVVDFLSNGPCARNPVRENPRRSSWPPVPSSASLLIGGFGFIEAEDQKEYFFHRNSLEAPLDFDRLAGGERVEFDVEQKSQGPARQQGARRLGAVSRGPATVRS